MTTTRAVVFAVLLTVCGLAITPFVGTALLDAEDDSSEEDEQRPMGAEVSAFMQSSGANTEEAVESKTFDATFEAAEEDERPDVVGDRVDRLERRLAELEAERDDLREMKDDGELTGGERVAYDARMSRLATQIDGLERAVDDVESRSVGVDEERLEELRAGAEDVAGPEVAQTASHLSVVEPPRGPPADASTRGSGPDGENGTPGQDGNADTGDGTPGQNGSADTGDEVPGQDGNADTGDETPGQDGSADTGDETPGQDEQSQAPETDDPDDGSQSSDTGDSGSNEGGQDADGKDARGDTPDQP